MSRGVISGQFLGDPGRRIFVLLREPAGAARNRGAVLVVPPFGEEMNKSRRLVTEAAQRLCESGVPVVVPDLFGTGDSEGDFRDARVELWLADLEMACRDAHSRGWPVRAVLAARLGCALAVAAANRGLLPAVAASVWWQPVLDGRRHFAQFLRLRVAAGGMRGGAAETVESLRGRLAAGESLEIAGYELSPELAREIEGLTVDSLPTQTGALHWFELVRDAGAAPPLPASRFVDKARATGSSVILHTQTGEPFWASTEIVRLPELVDRTAAALVPLVGQAREWSATDTRANA